MTTEAALSSNSPGFTPLPVRNKLLFAILSVIPIAASIGIIDTFFLNHTIRNWMISDPRQIAYWTAVLTVPHIIASLVTFADKEYLRHYRKTLTKGSLISLALGFGVPILLGPPGILIAMAFYTMYHNLMQQYGISLMMARQTPTFDFQVWKWLTVIPGGVAYTVLIAPNMGIGYDTDTAIMGCGIALFIATIFGFRFVRTILKNPNHTKIGLYYFISNMAMLYVGFGLILAGYGFLATLVPRVIHDLTAFTIYMVHDRNRNALTVHNPVYALPKKLGISPLVLCVPLSIAISYFFMNVLGNLFLVSLFVVSLNFMHYYMEGHMWKRGTPHRQHVPFV